MVCYPFLDRFKLISLRAFHHESAVLRCVCVRWRSPLVSLLSRTGKSFSPRGPAFFRSLLFFGDEFWIEFEISHRSTYTPRSSVPTPIDALVLANLTHAMEQTGTWIHDS